MESRMQMLLTSDGRPIIQHITVDEAIAILLAFGGYPVRPAARAMPAAAAPVAAGRPEQQVLALDLAGAVPAAPAANATPPAASPAAAPAAEAHLSAKGAHGAGRHPEGYAEIATVVATLTADGQPRLVRGLAGKLGISTRQVIHLLERTRGTSPMVLARLRQAASSALGVTACTQYDWHAMEAAVAARARHLPKSRRAVEAAAAEFVAHNL